MIMPLWYKEWRTPMLILQSLMGIAAFGYSYHRKPYWVLRLLIALIPSAAITYYAQHLFFQAAITPFAVFTQASVSLITYLMGLFICWCCLDETIQTVVFVNTAGYVAQSMAGCVKTIVKLIPVMAQLARDDWGILLLDGLCYGGLAVLLFFVFRRFTRNRESLINTQPKMIFSLLVLVYYIGMTWLIQDYTSGQSRASVIVSNLNAILMHAMIFVVQFNVIEHERLNNYVETLRELMHEQQAQYETSRESVQLINEKYHDLQSLLSSIKKVVPAEQVEQLKKYIARYDVHVKTGFEVLDVVLTEKMDLCLQRGITLTCNLGRTDFSFMEEIDLYTLFNNALTNAVNAVSALPDGSPRYIILTGTQEGNFISVHMENPCGENIQFTDGLPQTSGDPAMHGFGMKSMSRTAEKYGGAISASIEEGRFQLDILLLNLQDQ